MPRRALGEFEQMILLAIVRLEDEAYGVSVMEEIERQTDRDVSESATYLTLQRMETKGLVESRLGEATAERGGRRKRYFTITEKGLEKLRSSAAALFGMWEGLDPALREQGRR
jgi:DNA-binding PadR family transcriptional regulator